ncbi:2-C-methyl-D-erythritol 4-phosphate cytidylyltransferase [Acetonema longum]|uniref:Bifunctional enzyme IspD/IspF n=1 Tax=Acetonema longum DSM 6540 TaxID=1009370 RepID=F7NMH9_9FIRM|nr:2-C-methyl-D-erythritol 4-phosphate cytidylyltransferase [Acetonema longum]EGO62759.1 ispd/ispf bifunctional enzyme [Acetonema longum DSM 6540]
MVTAIIAAGGKSSRMGGQNKQFLTIASQPVLMHSIQAIVSCGQVQHLIIAASQEDLPAIKNLVSSLGLAQSLQFVEGGSERQYSVQNALDQAPADSKIILVHDGARPLVKPVLVRQVIEAAREFGAAGLAVPVKDTIKTADDNLLVTGTPPRNSLWAIQTPQAFRANLLLKAYDQAKQDGYLGTDDASLVERMGHPVKLVPSDYQNIKITTPDDLAVAESILSQRVNVVSASDPKTVQTGSDARRDEDGRETVRSGGYVERPPAGATLQMGLFEQSPLRVGIGYDVHRLVEGRKLILGGVEISHHLGLDGHSDADVLLHVVKDALLGAAGLGDIGRHFPDTDPAYKGVSSLLLLTRVREILAQAGYQVNNIDATVVAQTPKLAGYIQQMNQNIAAALAIPLNRVNVKATTTEGLGFAGRQEGIAAYAVAALYY